MHDETPAPRGAFTVSEGLERGLSPKQLRRPALQSGVRGLRESAPPPTLGDRCRRRQLVLPARAFFIAETVAQLLHAPVPLATEKDTTLHVGMPAPARAVRAEGLTGRRLSIAPEDLTARGGIRMTTAARAFCDLAGTFELHDLVATGDFLLRYGHLSRESLRGTIERHPGRRHRALLTEAAGLLDPRAESAPESIIRVALVQAGITGLVPNQVIRDARGAFIARSDFAFPSLKLIFEYQGDAHRTTRDQWRRDKTRIAKLRAAGWMVIEIAAEQLADLAGLITLVRDAIATAAARAR